MTQAKCVHSTPPTNTSALPLDPTRRRFLAVAAAASAAGAGTLAAAAFTPNDVPQAVTMPTGSPSLELRAAIRVLAKAHETLIVAKANNDEADAMFADWEAKNPKPASKRGTRKWLKRGCAYHLSVTAPLWQTMMEAEKTFAEAQAAVASVPIANAADVQALVACSVIYDEVELCRHNRAPIARVVAQEYFRLGKAVQS